MSPKTTQIFLEPVYIAFLLLMSVAGFLFGYFGAMLLHLGDQIANDPQIARTVLAKIPEFNNAMFGLIGALILVMVALLLLHSRRMRQFNREFFGIAGAGTVDK